MESQVIPNRYCPRCETTKPASEFSKNRSRKSGYNTYCGKCQSAASVASAKKPNALARTRAWIKSPEGRASRRDTYLFNEHRIRAKDYDEMLHAQQGVCAICKQFRSKIDQWGNEVGLHVDHDHATGRVRGLLCNWCNTGIGALGDNATRLRAAADYVESFILASPV